LGSERRDGKLEYEGVVAAQCRDEELFVAEGTLLHGHGNGNVDADSVPVEMGGETVDVAPCDIIYVSRWPP
jgi:hypothetical protein